MTINFTSSNKIHRCLAIALISLSFQATAFDYKHSAVPTQDIKQQALPDSLSGSTKSHSTMVPLINTITGSTLTTKHSYSQNIIIDSNESSSIVVLSPQAELISLQLESPDSQLYLNETTLTGPKLTVENITLGDQSFTGKRIQLPASSIGTWKVTVNSVKGSSFNGKPSGYILVKGDPNYSLVTHLDNTFTTQNSATHLVAYIASPTATRLSRKSEISDALGLIRRASATITQPNGHSVSMTLNDQGINGDKIAGDGKFTGPVPTGLTGVYTTEVYVEGVRDDGILFSRSTADLYPVEKQSYKFSKLDAKLKSLGGTRTAIQIPVSTQPDAHPEIFVGAEVWGTNNKGKPEAATWVGGIVQLNNDKENTQLELGFDYRWLSQANLRAPYELRNLRLQTVETNTPIAQLKRLSLKSAPGIIPKSENGLTNHYLNQSRSLVSKAALEAQPYLTDNMLVGPAPGKNRPANLNKANKSKGKVMLVHGYCSSDVWKSSHFTGDIKFKDFKKSRSHNLFAQLISEFGKDYSSFSVIAHSQGGAAALQLYAKYFSKLDYSSNGRRIQSVGTPYQGTALAGNIAAIGKVFGVACGKNVDLTYRGASNWLATIPYWARSQVNYYTTSFTKKWWRPDWCNIASDFILSDPEDGVTEKWSGQLAGANNRGHKTGWCHTKGMRDPSQAFDRSRNNQMNQKAAR